MLGPILIILCTFLWATDAVFRLPLANNMDSHTIVLVEHMICVACTLPLFLIRFREIQAIKLKGWASLAFIGIMGSAGGTILFTSSYRYINPSVTILLQKMQPIFAVLGARF